MDTEQAEVAVQSMEAAPMAGAGNEREQAMTSLLSQMTEESPEETAGTESASVAAVEQVEVEPEMATEVSLDTESESKKARNFRGRWDHLDEQERRVVELTTKRGLTLSESYRAVYGTDSGSAGLAEMTSEVRSETGKIDARIAEQEERLAELRRQKTAAKGDLAAYDEASEAYLEAREQLRELKVKREQAAHEVAQRRMAERQRLEESGRVLLEAEFPDALTPGTELYEACAEELAYLREANSPLASDPHAPYKVARRLAKTLGYHARSGDSLYQSVREANVEAGFTKAGVQARRTARPLPTGGSPVEAPVASLERRVSGVRSTGEMLELMKEIGTPFEVLLRK